jgi:hypothetical protein
METNQSLSFRPATKREAKLRLAIIGPSGSGKTYSALAIASNLGKRIALIDTERGSASKYADLFQFDTLDLVECSPIAYVRAIRAAAEAGYEVCIIDSLSHAWNGKGGALELVDEAARRSKSGNSFGAWREVTPLHNALVDEMISSRMHIIATMRSKTEWSQEKDERGKTQIRKIGMAPIQRDGIEYEFDVVMDMDQDNTAIVTKTRCHTLFGAVLPKPGKDVSDKLCAWLHGTPNPQERPPEASAQEPKAETLQAQANSVAATQPPEISDVELLAMIAEAGSLDDLSKVAELAKKLPASLRAAVRKAYIERKGELEAAV